MLISYLATIIGVVFVGLVVVLAINYYADKRDGRNRK